VSRPTTLPSFDEMLALHQKDPAALAELRNKLIGDAIAEAPAHLRSNLEHLVFRMDRARESADTPLEAAEAAARLMTESSERLHSALDHLQDACAGHQADDVLRKMRTPPASALSMFTK
jgi:exonuclease VII small subunit